MVKIWSGDLEQIARSIIETSRGHRDKYHNEPIVLKDRETETDLYFLPPKNALELMVTELPEDVRSLDLKDDNDRQIATLEVKNDTASYTIEPGNRMNTPWKLHFQKAQAKVEIEGVTGWSKNDKSEFFYEFPHGALWTPESDSWFPIHSNRWLITSHKCVIYGQDGEEKSTSFRIHNNGMESKKIVLDLEFPNKKWKVQLSDKEVELAPNEEKEVTLSWTANENDQIVHLRATNENYTTYSTLFISYKHWSAYWFYRNERPGDERKVLMSSDGGVTWKFAESRDLTI